MRWHGLAVLLRVVVYVKGRSKEVQEEHEYGTAVGERRTTSSLYRPTFQHNVI
jgi:hypothetical protein